MIAGARIEPGNVLTFGDREQPDPNAPWVGPQLQLAWRSADTLEVRTNSLRWRGESPIRVERVTVVFRPLDSPRSLPHPQPVMLQ